MTYETIPISQEECRYMHKYKATKLGFENKKFDLVPNKENIVKYYVQGWQRQGKDIMGTQLVCEGEHHIFKNYVSAIKISNIVIHHTDVIYITNTTLLIENEDILDKDNKRIIPSRKELETCTFDNIRYIWNLQAPTCNLYQIKSLHGQIASDSKTELFTGNNSLIQLDVKERITLCGRNLYKTDFRNIFILKINEEAPIKQDIEPIHISILTEVGVRDKYIYSRLKSDFEGNLKKLAYNQCKNNQITQLQLTRLQSRIHSTNLEVFQFTQILGNL